MRRLIPALAAAAVLALTGGAAASATEAPTSPYVIAVWEITTSDAADPFGAPQELVGTVLTNDVSSTATVGEQARTFVGLECGKVYQIDPYVNDDTTAALLAGGILYGPGNPAESLANGNWLVVTTDECEVVVPEKPAPVVDEVVDCEAEHVTITTTDYVLNEETNTWVTTEPALSSRPLTDTEASECAGPAPDALVVTGPWEVVSENCVERTEQRIITTTTYKRVGVNWVEDRSSQRPEQRVIPLERECPATEQPPVEEPSPSATPTPEPTPSATPTTEPSLAPSPTERRGSEDLAVTGPLDAAFLVVGAAVLIAFGLIVGAYGRRGERRVSRD